MDIHWDQLGGLFLVTGFALHWVSSFGGLARAALARSLHALAMAMMAFGAFGILFSITDTTGTATIVLNALGIFAILVCLYFLRLAWTHWPRGGAPRADRLP